LVSLLPLDTAQVLTNSYKIDGKKTTNQPTKILKTGSLSFIFSYHEQLAESPFICFPILFFLSNKMLMKLFGLKALLILKLFFKTHTIKYTVKTLCPAIALLSW